MFHNKKYEIQLAWMHSAWIYVAFMLVRSVEEAACWRQLASGSSTHVWPWTLSHMVSQAGPGHRRKGRDSILFGLPSGHRQSTARPATVTTRPMSRELEQRRSAIAIPAQTNLILQIYSCERCGTPRSRLRRARRRRRSWGPAGF
jgi:hypothetical protein